MYERPICSIGNSVAIIIERLLGANTIATVFCNRNVYVLCLFVVRKIVELEEELKVVTNNMKSLEIAEQEVTCSVVYRKCEW